MKINKFNKKIIIILVSALIVVVVSVCLIVNAVEQTSKIGIDTTSVEYIHDDSLANMNLKTDESIMRMKESSQKSRAIQPSYQYATQGINDAGNIKQDCLNKLKLSSSNSDQNIINNTKEKVSREFDNCVKKIKDTLTSLEKSKKYDDEISAQDRERLDQTIERYKNIN